MGSKAPTRVDETPPLLQQGTDGSHQIYGELTFGNLKFIIVCKKRRLVSYFGCFLEADWELYWRIGPMHPSSTEDPTKCSENLQIKQSSFKV